MKKIYLLLLILTNLTINAQSWDFNNVDGLNGWTTFRLNDNYTASHIILSTNGQNNPRFEQSSANVDADVKKFAIVKMRVATGGPTFLRVQYGSNNGDYSATAINTGTSGFETYYINMTDNNWTGTFSDIKLWFRENDGTDGGGTHNSNNVAIDIESIEFVDNIYSGATELYVDLESGNDNSIGTSASPLKSITYALNTAAENNIANVYVKSGTYNLTSSIDITAAATTPIVLSPEPGGSVTINTIAQRGIRIYDGASNIEIKGFEINGQSNNTDHWVFVSQYVWLPQTTTDAITGGGIGFRIEEGENIKITNNHIHDFYQKAINIEDGRYVKIEGNIINNIGLTSLSGGHGIMRQQGFGSFPDADDPNKYRWEIDGNLIFNVHQRIYSWVPWKGYLNMTLDEGKPILIDETPNHDTGMKARINNNVVAFSKIDAIRLKPTNNLEVTNNTVYTRGHHADGITDTANGFDAGTYGTPFLNFKANNNAVDVYDQKQTYELGDSDTSTGSSYSNNYGAFGTINPNNAATIVNATLFNDPDNGDFSLSDGSLTNVGINPTVLTSLINRANSFSVNIQDDFWEHEHLKMMQTLWDNVPGLEDGIANNESVFTDAGTYDISDLEFNRGRKALYFAVNTTWKSDNGVTNAVLNQGNGLDQYDGMYEIIVPEEFSDWYDDVIANHLNSSNNPYDRIRYGASVLAQDKVFQDNVLHVVELENTSEYTQTEGDGFNVTLDGDILIDFKYTPVGDEVFDLLIANDITNAFNNITIEGYTGTYTLEIVDEAPNKILRLTLTSSTLSTTEFNQENIELYPNPSNENQEFSLNVDISKANVNLYDILGKKIQLVKKNNMHKPLKYIKSGLYIITIEFEGKTQILKWLVK